MMKSKQYKYPKPRGHKYISGFEGYYSISKEGKVFSCMSNIFMSPYIDGAGYKRTHLCAGGKEKSGSVHRMIMETFRPHKNQELLQVNHVDCNKLNNQIDNLEWCTSAENVRHARENGLLDKMKEAHKRQRKAVNQYTLEGKLIEKFCSVHDANRKTGIHRYCINLVAEGKRKTAGGYKWKFV